MDIVTKAYPIASSCNAFWKLKKNREVPDLLQFYNSKVNMATIS